jgi:lipopolysaccharide/colanic/teichoic acid biosynthesis glycosyltransferase
MSISWIRERGSLYQILGLSQQRATARSSAVPLSVRVAKRSIDLLFSTVGLLIFALLLPFIALAIRLDSRGPIFYRQRRAAALCSRSTNGRCEFVPFDMLKFRTMRVDAEAATGAVLAEENDPRVTRIGRFLRRTRLDELPQLWNVFTGEMSLVGPRPERPELLENLTLAVPFFEERMRDCKPGITGLAQVSLSYTGRPTEGSALSRYDKYLNNPFGFVAARGALADDLRGKLLFDLAYVAGLERFSTFLFTELYVIAKTPLVMLKGLGR